MDPAKNSHDLYSLRYAKFVVPLVKAVQEEQVIIESLRKEITYLKAIQKDIELLKAALLKN